MEIISNQYKLFPDNEFIPRDILILIFSFINLKDYNNLYICKQWKRFMDRCVGFFVPYEFINEKGKSDCIKTEAALDIFTNLGYDKLWISFRSEFKELPLIKSLYIQNVKGMSELSILPKTLKKLKVGSGNVFIYSIENIGISYFDYSNLEHLNIDRDDFMIETISLNLKILKINIFKQESLKSILKCFPNLEKLELSINNNVEWDLLEICSLKFLKYLSITNLGYDEKILYIEPETDIYSTSIEELKLNSFIKKSCFPNLKKFKFYGENATIHSPTKEELIVYFESFEYIKPKPYNYEYFINEFDWKQWIEKLEYLFLYDLSSNNNPKFHPIFIYLLKNKSANEEEVELIKQLVDRIGNLTDKLSKTLIMFLKDKNEKYMIWFLDIIGNTNCYEVLGSLLNDSKWFIYLIELMIKNNNFANDVHEFIDDINDKNMIDFIISYMNHFPEKYTFVEYGFVLECLQEKKFSFESKEIKILKENITRKILSL